MIPLFEQPSPQLAAFCRQNHISHLWLYGSAARGQMRPDSDVDLLVEFEKGHAPSLAGFARLKQQLAAFFGKSTVDLATPSILRNPYRRQSILADRKELYAA